MLPKTQIKGFLFPSPPYESHGIEKGKVERKRNGSSLTSKVDSFLHHIILLGLQAIEGERREPE